MITKLLLLAIVALSGCTILGPSKPMSDLERAIEAEKRAAVEDYKDCLRFIDPTGFLCD